MMEISTVDNPLVNDELKLMMITGTTRNSIWTHYVGEIVDEECMIF
jgi:hypothetical protein